MRLSQDSSTDSNDNSFPPKLDDAVLEKNIIDLGLQIFEEIEHTNSPSVLSPDYWTQQLMNWAMEDELFKVAVFRFIGVFPDLHTSEAILKHAQEYLGPVAKRLPLILQKGLSVSPNSLPAKVAARAIRRQIKTVANSFIVGASPTKALPSLKRLRSNGIAFTIDLLGEAAVSEKESLSYVNQYIDLIDALQSTVPDWEESRPLVAKHMGEDTPLNISVKLSALYSQSKAVSHTHSVKILSSRFAQILRKAKQAGAFVYLDMEDSSTTSIILDTFKKVLMRNEFRGYPKVGIVLQAYLRRTERDLKQLIDWVRHRGTKIGVRLVKGAYWDTETVWSRQKDWPNPVWEQKSGSDAAFEHLTKILFAHTNLIYPAFGTHNIRSLCHTITCAEHFNIPSTDFELQMLYGMAEPIKQAFIKKGYLVRDYAPVGELVPGMGYLVRRLLENTSNQGFLKLNFHDNTDPELLLRKPCVSADDTGKTHISNQSNNKFSNEPLTDFSISTSRDKLKLEIDRQILLLADAPDSIFPIIAGKTTACAKAITVNSPNDPSLQVSLTGLAELDLATNAASRLSKYFKIWRNTPVSTRSDILFRAAEIMRNKKTELTAAIIIEAGKQWIEADADVSEAIDFLNYYGQEALRLAKKRQMGQLPGEINSYFYEPRGVCLVISPWNFPLAIPCGMFSAALVTGNCAILKPAETTSRIARKLFEIFLEAGLPPEAAAFLPADGESTGAALVQNTNISTVVFTGSKEVGLQIINTASNTQDGQTHVKRVVAEMGGKNSIIVDHDADLDEAVRGVVYSAFGYQGQKCSACSKVIVVGEQTYSRFATRLAEAVKSIEIGPSTDPAFSVGPVIDESQYTKISKLIESASKDCRLLAQASPAKDASLKGHYIMPTVFSDIPDDHFILKTEIFGPVLALLTAQSFEEAIRKARDTEYALTGAVYSRSPEHIQKAIETFRVGNLYINRGSTGALVLRQPFGGAHMSGTGSKAGGPDYLLQFMIPRTTTENTMRRGFAPELS